MQLNENTCVQIFYKMMKSRLFEEMAVKLKEMGFVHDSLYLSYGQEAVAASVCALSLNDMVFASHRSTAQAIALEVSPESLFAELCGLSSGVCAGRSGLEAMAERSVNFFGATPIPGGNFAKAVGAALACKLMGNNKAAICYAGDGAAALGSFSEALNMASLKKLPVVFFIENNCYAHKMRSDEIINIKDISDRAKGFNIPGFITDGNNPADVYTATYQAMEYAKANSAPVIVESKTYRLAGFTYDEVQDYRSEEEAMEWLKYDPIENHTQYMIKNGMGTMEDFILLRSKIKQEIDEAVDDVLRLLGSDEGIQMGNAEV